MFDGVEPPRVQRPIRPRRRRRADPEPGRVEMAFFVVCTAIVAGFWFYFITLFFPRWH